MRKIFKEKSPKINDLGLEIIGRRAFGSFILFSNLHHYIDFIESTKKWGMKKIKKIYIKKLLKKTGHFFESVGNSQFEKV